MQMKTALLSITAALMLTAGLTGCGTSTNEGMRANGVRTNQVRPYSMNGMNFNAHRNYNTYGTRPYGMNDMNGSTLNGLGGNSLYGANPGGTRDGHGARMYGVNGTSNGTTPYSGTHMYGTGMTGHNFNQSGKVEMSQKIASKVSKIPGVNRANVMLSGNNAYVAVSTKSHTSMGAKSTTHKMTTHSTSADVPQELKSKISAEVKKMAPNCQNVYVSADANFVDRMSNFAKMTAEGHPIQGLTVEFQDMVNRLFPTNAAPRTNNTAPGPAR